MEYILDQEKMQGLRFEASRDYDITSKYILVEIGSRSWHDPRGTHVDSSKHGPGTGPGQVVTLNRPKYLVSVRP